MQSSPAVCLLMWCFTAHGGASLCRLQQAYIEKRLLNQVLKVTDHSHEPLVQQGHYQALPQGRALSIALVRAIWRI